jgi:hypothetical protein
VSRGALRLVHAVAGGLALLTITTFWVSTVAVELAGSPESIVAVKRAIPWGLLVLVPAMAATGITGMRLTRNARGRIVRRKLLRMRIVAALGALVLVPCVLYLGLTASVNDLSTTFYAVQAVELLAGAVNITLLGLNTRDGLRLSGRLRRKPRATEAVENVRTSA